MIVWRIEDAQGRGPFNGAISNITYKYQDATGINVFRPPPPQRDRDLGDHFQRNHYCGFKDQQQFHDWFGPNPEHHKILGEAGLGLTIYEVNDSDVKIGDHQVIFVKANATKVDRQLFT